MKRRYQKGCIYKAGKRVKVWRAKYRDDVLGVEGRIQRVHRHVTLGTVTQLPTKTDARAVLERLIGQPATTQMLFRELVERWKVAAIPTLREPTAAFYENNLKSHILPRFGEMDIAAITRYEVMRLLSDKSTRLTRASLKGVKVTLGRVLGFAVECGWLSANPISSVKLPYGKPGIERKALDPALVVRLADSLDSPYRELVLFVAMTGAKISEVIALRWEDIVGGTIRINRRIHKGKLGEVKTKNCLRVIPATPAILTLLEPLREGDGWIFRNTRGNPIIPTSALRSRIKPAARRLGIGRIGWHDLRHSFISWLGSRGYSPKTVAALCGHGDVSVTLNTYTHPDDSDRRAAMEEVSLLLWHDAAQSASESPSDVESKEVLASASARQLYPKKGYKYLN